MLSQQYRSNLFFLSRNLLFIVDERLQTNTGLAYSSFNFWQLPKKIDIFPII